MTKLIGWMAVAGVLIIGLVGCGALTDEAKRGSFDDGTITAGVQQSLAADPGAAFTAVDVKTASGTVYLSGTVANTDAKQRATTLAQHVAGVREVVNNLQMPAGA